MLLPSRRSRFAGLSDIGRKAGGQIVVSVVTTAAVAGLTGAGARLLDRAGELWTPPAAAASATLGATGKIVDRLGEPAALPEAPAPYRTLALSGLLDLPLPPAADARFAEAPRTDAPGPAAPVQSPAPPSSPPRERKSAPTKVAAASPPPRRPAAEPAPLPAAIAAAEPIPSGLVPSGYLERGAGLVRDAVGWTGSLAGGVLDAITGG